MKCLKCGEKTEDNSRYCKKCIEEVTPKKNKIKISYENDDTIELTAPIIIESHTFIDENMKDKIDDKIEKDKKKNTPKKVKKQKETKKTEDENIQNIYSKQKKKQTGVKIVAVFALAFMLYSFVRTNPTVNQALQAKAAADLSKLEWTSSTFIIDGKKYKLDDDYKLYNNRGWDYDKDRRENLDNKILAKNEKTTATIELYNNKYQDNKIDVGVKNSSNTSKKASEGKVWSVKVNNYNKKNIIPFVLPGNIKNGSTLEEVYRAYGQLKPEEVYKSTVLGYTVCNYSVNHELYLELIVYEEGGVMGFTYKRY